MDRSLEKNLGKSEKGKATPLPQFSYDKITDILHHIEKNGRPKNLEHALNIWTEILRKSMKYDAVNFAIFRGVPLDETQGDFSDKVDITTLGLSNEQFIILKKTTENLYNQAKKSGDPIMEEILKDLLMQIQNKNVLGVVAGIMQSPTLQRYLMEDGIFGNNWHALYQKRNIPQLIQHGIGSCKTFSIMSKMVLESANIRYGLGIRKIEVIEDSGFHVFLRIHTSNGVQIYDPTSIVYKKEEKKGDYTEK